MPKDSGAGYCPIATYGTLSWRLNGGVWRSPFENKSLLFASAVGIALLVVTCITDELGVVLWDDIVDGRLGWLFCL